MVKVGMFRITGKTILSLNVKIFDFTFALELGVSSMNNNDKNNNNKMVEAVPDRLLRFTVGFQPRFVCDR